MIDHTRITVADFANTKAWYEKVLAAIGYKLLVEVPGAVTGQADVAGFGDPAEGEPSFWLVAETPDNPAQAALNVGFRVKSRAMVDAFCEAALTEGATDKERRRSQPNEGTNSYSSRVRDPHGNALSATCYGNDERSPSPKAKSSSTYQSQEMNISASSAATELSIPRNVARFEKLIYGALAVSVLILITATDLWRYANAMTGFLLIFYIFYFAGFILLTRTAVYKRRNWARIALLVIIVLLVISGLIRQEDRFEIGAFTQALGIVEHILYATAFYFSFTGDANGWFQD